MRGQIVTDEPPKPNRWRWRWLVVSVAVVTAILFLREMSTTVFDRVKLIRIGMSRSEVRRVMGPFAHQFGERRVEKSGTIEINSDCYTTDNQARGYLKEFGLLPKKYLARTQYPIEIQYDRSDRVTSLRVP